MSGDTSSRTDSFSIRIERDFAAPPERVFRYWVDADAMHRWFSPKGCTMVSTSIDARPGGKWAIRFQSDAHPDRVYDEFGTFHEIVAPTRVVFTLTQQDRDGNAGPETVITVALSRTEGGTRMHFTQTGFDSVSVRDDHTAGLHSCFDKLDDDLVHHDIGAEAAPADEERSL